MPSLVPRSAEDITPAWLSEALRETGLLQSGAVASVAAEPVGVGRGYISQNLRIHVGYDGAPPEAPASLIGKLPSFVEYDEATSAIVDLMCANEVNFYQRLRDQLPVRAPRLVWGGMDAAARRYALLIEDMGDLRTADQVNSCSFEDVCLIVTALARVHARWWGSPDLDRLDWLPRSEALGPLLQRFAADGWDFFWRRFGPEVPPEFERIGAGIVASLPALFQAHKAPMTLAHGDYRLENFLFGQPGTSEELVVLDWQLVHRGPGLRDLGYFMAHSLTVEARRAWEKEVLDVYARELQARGVRGYPFADVYDDYRRGLLMAAGLPIGAARTVALAAENPPQGLSPEQRYIFDTLMAAGDQLSEAIALRNVAAIMDTRAWELLPG